MTRDLPPRGDRPWPLPVTVAGLGIALVGLVIGVALAAHVRLRCGGDIYALIQLYCTEKTHPYAVPGLVVAGVSLVGVVVLAALFVAQRRRRRVA